MDDHANVKDIAAYCKGCYVKVQNIGRHFAKAKSKCTETASYEECDADGKRSGVIREWIGPFPVSARTQASGSTAF